MHPITQFLRLAWWRKGNEDGWTLLVALHPQGLWGWRCAVLQTCPTQRVTPTQRLKMTVKMWVWFVFCCAVVCVGVCVCACVCVRVCMRVYICVLAGIGLWNCWLKLLYVFFVCVCVLGNLTFPDILTPTPQHAHTHRPTYTHTHTLSLSLSLCITHTHTHTLSLTRTRAHAHSLCLCYLSVVSCSVLLYTVFFSIMIGFSFLSTLHFFYFFPLFC